MGRILKAFTWISYHEMMRVGKDNLEFEDYDQHQDGCLNDESSQQLLERIDKSKLTGA